ncbi:hypothetical protein GWN42_23615 [candidate division KSB1 bacterium]|nr:hypothetical protein [candidate division KSB1 bacterium]
MKCNKVEILISAYLDGEVTASEWRDAEAHIEQCTKCAEILRAFQASTVLYQKELEEQEPSPSVWSKIEERIEPVPRASWIRQLTSWVKQTTDRFVLRPSTPVRLAQVGVALAAVAVFVSIQLLHKPDSDVASSKQGKQPRTSVSEPLTVPYPDVAQDKLRLAQATLVSQVKSYFDKAGVLLLEVKNSDPEPDSVGLNSLRASSQNLLEETILIKESLKNADLTVLQKTVEQLEMVLFDIANLNDSPENEEFEWLKAAILQQNLIIKIEIYDAEEIRQKTTEPMSGPEAPKPKDRQKI